MRYSFVLVLLAASLAQAGENWPGWRGPTGMGQTDEKDLPVDWGGKEKKNVVWQVSLFEQPDKIRRDQNQSSPIVWGDRVFVTVSYWPPGVTATEFPEHHVLCFRASDGKRLWDRKVTPGPWLLKDLRGGYTAPTPACDGQRVYVVFGSAVIAALNFDGKEIWRHEIKPHLFDVAIGASPIVHNGTVLMVCDQTGGKKASCLLAYDGPTGTLKWRKAHDADWAHSTPAIINVAGKAQLILGNARGPQGVDPETGEPIWWYQAPGRVGDTVTPVFGGGLLYVDSGRGGPAVAVDPTGKGDITRTHLKWKLAGVPDGFSSPLVVGEYLYRLHSPGVLTCRKLADGAEVYKERLPGIETAASPFATPDGRIFCVSAGKSYVLRAGPRPERLGAGDLGDPGKASPAVANGRIFVKGSRFLYCLGLR